MQKIYELYQNGRYQEAVELIDLDDFVAKSDPVLANIVAASYFKLGQVIFLIVVSTHAKFYSNIRSLIFLYFVSELCVFLQGVEDL